MGIAKCSWCGKFLGIRENLPAGVVTHGICDECLAGIEDEYEETERKEKERQEALKPDKEKIYNLANTVGTIDMPSVNSKEAKTILSWLINELDDLSKLTRQKAEDL